MKFSGFSPKAIQFLIDLSQNNNREWFAANKQIYKDYVESGMLGLFESISDTMLLIDPNFCVEPKPAKVLARIYRDIRFSKDKSPYRTHTWFTFKRDKDMKEYPSYYFGVSADDYTYGVGFYEANKSVMDNLRNSIDENPREVIQIIDRINNETKFSIEGEKYKKVLNPTLEEPLKSLYQSKNIYLFRQTPINESFYSEELSYELSEQFLKTSEFYNYLLSINNH